MNVLFIVKGRMPFLKLPFNRNGDFFKGDRSECKSKSSKRPFLVQVGFTAVRGATTVGDVAIDTISVTADPCTIIPSKAKLQSFSAGLYITTANQTIFL